MDEEKGGLVKAGFPSSHSEPPWDQDPQANPRTEFDLVNCIHFTESGRRRRVRGDPVTTVSIETEALVPGEVGRSVYSGSTSNCYVICICTVRTNQLPGTTKDRKNLSVKFITNWWLQSFSPVSVSALKTQHQSSPD